MRGRAIGGPQRDTYRHAVWHWWVLWLCWGPAYNRPDLTGLVYSSSWEYVNYFWLTCSRSHLSRETWVIMPIKLCAQSWARLEEGPPCFNIFWLREWEPTVGSFTSLPPVIHPFSVPPLAFFYVYVLSIADGSLAHPQDLQSYPSTLFDHYLMVQPIAFLFT